MISKKFEINFKLSVAISIFAVSYSLYFNHAWSDSRANELSKLDQEIATTQLKIDADKLNLEQMKKRAPSSLETSLASQLLDQYLKFNGRFSSVVNGIVLSSNGNSFALNKIISQSQVKNTEYTQTLYSIEAEASFIAIGKFLEKMEDSPLLTEVDSIEITRIGNEMKRCKAKINLFSYVGSAI